MECAVSREVMLHSEIRQVTVKSWLCLVFG